MNTLEILRSRTVNSMDFSMIGSHYSLIPACQSLEDALVDFIPKMGVPVEFRSNDWFFNLIGLEGGQGMCVNIGSHRYIYLNEWMSAGHSAHVLLHEYGHVLRPYLPGDVQYHVGKEEAIVEVTAAMIREQFFGAPSMSLSVAAATYATFYLHSTNDLDFIDNGLEDAVYSLMQEFLKAGLVPAVR